MRSVVSAFPPIVTGRMSLLKRGPKPGRREFPGSFAETPARLLLRFSFFAADLCRSGLSLMCEMEQNQPGT